MTPYRKVYDAFLVRILDDEYGYWTKEEVEADMSQLLDIAIAMFKFPRASLKRTPEGFEGDLSNKEIQILATYMKCEWLDRNIMTWDNIKPQYEERDFSIANMLAKLTDALKKERENAKALEASYYRSRDNKPFDFKKLAGG